MSGPVLGDGDPDTADLLNAARAAWTAGHRRGAIRRWRMAMAATPGQVAPYVNLARAGGTGVDIRPWVERAAATLAVDDALVARNLAVLAQQRGQSRNAIRHLRRALALTPGQPTALGILAKIPASPDCGHDPLRWCLYAALTDPARESAWLDALTRLAGGGREAAAAAWLAAIPIALDEWSVELLRLAVHVQTKTSPDAAALPVATMLTRRDPLDSSVRRIRALLLRRSGDAEAAIREARRAVVLSPGSFDNLCRTGSELTRLDRDDEAIRLFRRGLCVIPERRAEIVENLGASLVKKHAAPEARAVLREVLVARPDRAQAYMNLSTLEVHEQDLGTAARFGHFSVLIDGGSADACYNLAVVYRHQARLAEARVMFDWATALDDKPMYRFVRAMLELGDGDPDDGVARYDVRWDVPNFSSSRRLGAEPTLALPVWQGEPRPEATLAVWAEQGIGDELWFAGYLPWAAGRVGHVVAEVAPSLVGLMQRSFPTIEVRGRDAPGTEEAVRAADLQAAAGGLMRPYGAGSAPVPCGYLRADPERVARLRRRYLGDRRGTRVIGLSWRSVKPIRGRSFEAPLEAWGPLFAILDAVFVSLQYGDVEADVRLLQERFGVDLIADPEIDAYRDMDAFAAQVAAMDDVVSIANSTVPMAHALGKPVEVVARIIQDDWRYARGAAATRWLPTARCVWQTTAGDWTTPIGILAERLRRGP